MSTVAIIYFVVTYGRMTSDIPYLPPVQTHVTKADCYERADFFNKAHVMTKDGKQIYAYCLVDEPD